MFIQNASQDDVIALFQHCSSWSTDTPTFLFFNNEYIVTKELCDDVKQTLFQLYHQKQNDLSLFSKNNRSLLNEEKNAVKMCVVDKFQVEYDETMINVLWNEYLLDKVTVYLMI